MINKRPNTAFTARTHTHSYSTLKLLDTIHPCFQQKCEGFKILFDFHRLSKSITFGKILKSEWHFSFLNPCLGHPLGYHAQEPCIIMGLNLYHSHFCVSSLLSLFKRAEYAIQALKQDCKCRVRQPHNGGFDILLGVYGSAIDK